LYQNDIGLVDIVKGDDKYFIKMVPRYDPATLEKGYKRSANINPFQRFAQAPFDPEHWRQVNPELDI
jgi:hypothetical protein